MATKLIDGHLLLSLSLTSIIFTLKTIGDYVVSYDGHVLTNLVIAAITAQVCRLGWAIWAR